MVREYPGIGNGKVTVAIAPERIRADLEMEDLFLWCIRRFDEDQFHLNKSFSVSRFQSFRTLNLDPYYKGHVARASCRRIRGLEARGTIVTA